MLIFKWLGSKEWVTCEAEHFFIAPPEPPEPRYWASQWNTIIHGVFLHWSYSWGSSYVRSLDWFLVGEMA